MIHKSYLFHSYYVPTCTDLLRPFPQQFFFAIFYFLFLRILCYLYHTTLTSLTWNQTRLDVTWFELKILNCCITFVSQNNHLKWHHSCFLFAFVTLALPLLEHSASWCDLTMRLDCSPLPLGKRKCMLNLSFLFLLGTFSYQSCQNS